MVVARIIAVSLAMAKRKNKDRNAKKKEHYLTVYAQQTKEATSKKRLLKYRKFPFAVWFFSLVTGGSGLAVLAFILTQRHLLFEEFDHLSLVWKYLICVGLMLFGAISLLTSDIYTLVVNKKLGFVLQESKSLICRRRYKAHKLSDFKELHIVRRGHVSRDTDTTNYTIIFEFEDGKKLDTIYDRRIKDIKKKYADILLFLGRDEGINFADIKYRDESTTTQKRFVYQSPFEYASGKSSKQTSVPKHKDESFGDSNDSAADISIVDETKDDILLAHRHQQPQSRPKPQSQPQNLRLEERESGVSQRRSLYVDV